MHRAGLASLFYHMGNGGDGSVQFLLGSLSVVRLFFLNGFGASGIFYLYFFPIFPRGHFCGEGEGIRHCSRCFFLLSSSIGEESYNDVLDVFYSSCHYTLIFCYIPWYRNLLFPATLLDSFYGLGSVSRPWGPLLPPPRQRKVLEENISKNGGKRKMRAGGVPNFRRQ
ncbi:hypothetical protein GGR52DRAFT_296547 [Hypoxylon sp. FL1284]|nr:hypothetical protein GGR52DRAFT_296547 [Hypoxylon sp. FL1284]